MALVRIQVRRDPAATWASTNPVLAAGEPGLETDTGKIKYGDGVRAWNSLSYSSGVVLGSTVPPATGTAAAGTSQEAARADHSHAMPTNIQAQTVSSTGSATVGGNLTVQGQLVGGLHRHQADDINGLAAAVFARIASSIKAGSNIQATVDSTAQTITLSSTTAGTLPLSITLNPADVATTNDSASFSAAAIGGSAVIEYAWQVTADGGASWSDVPGANGTTLSITGLTSAQDGNRYRLRASSASEIVYSTAALLRTATIAITAQPPDATVDVGQLVRLAVSAVAGTAPVSYQWQRRPDASAEWQNVPGATQDAYAFTLTSATDADGDQYRAVAFALGQSAESRTAVVIARVGPPQITSQPEDTQDVSGAASFAVAAAGGTSPIQYDWQRRGGSSATWSSSSAFASLPTDDASISGQGTPTLSLSSQGANQHLREYRVRIVDASGREAVSRIATLSTLSLAITLHPADYSSTDGATLPSGAFAAEGEADGGVTYQWQRSNNGGTTWTNISGATSATYGGIAVSYTDDAAMFRCAITGDGQTLFTTSADLTVAPPALTISSQPSSVTAHYGSATFSFGFTGGPAGTSSVYWESSVPGGGWVRVPGATSTTLALSGLTIDSNGTLYRGVVQKGAASAITSTATLSVPGVLIFLQPVDATAVNGGAATFTVDFSSVECSLPTVQWQSRSTPSASWQFESGYTGKSVTFPSLTTARSGTQFRARVVCGASETFSNFATLTVTVPPVVITTQPADATAALGGASFSFAFSGGDSSTPTIRWERALPGGAFAPIVGATTSTLTLTGITSPLSGAQYRATVTIGSQSATTRSAVLTVAGAAITLHPSDVVAVNGSASFAFDFSATACASPLIQWEKKRSADTAWVAVQGGTAKTLALSGLIPDDSNWQYRAFVECGGATTHTSAATLTVPSYEFFSSQPASQSVQVGEQVTLSYQGLFQASTYSARWQTRRIGQSAWTYFTPAGASQQSITFAASLNAHHLTEWRVEIKVNSGFIYSNVATLTVGITTSSIGVDVAGSSDLIAVAYGRGAYVALSSEQTALARRSPDGGRTWGYSFLPSSTYWDGIVAAPSGDLLAYASGDSGTYQRRWVKQERLGSSYWSLFRWERDDRRPSRPATVARSTDGGLTWSLSPFPFFVGSGLRVWCLPSVNALVAFFLDDASTALPVLPPSHIYAGWASAASGPQLSSFSNGLPPRGTGNGGAMRMAVSTDNGASWTRYDTPLATSMNALDANPALNAQHPEITSLAASPSGIVVATSARYGINSGTGRFSEIAGQRRLLYRNITSQGWGPISPAATATVGVAKSTNAYTGGVIPRLSLPSLT